MTRLFNDPVRFCDEVVDGFVAANGMWVRRVRGGVARSTRTPEGQVAVVIGGVGSRTTQPPSAASWTKPEC